MLLGMIIGCRRRRSSSHILPCSSTTPLHGFTTSSSVPVPDTVRHDRLRSRLRFPQHWSPPVRLPPSTISQRKGYAAWSATAAMLVESLLGCCRSPRRRRTLCAVSADEPEARTADSHRSPTSPSGVDRTPRDSWACRRTWWLRCIMTMCVSALALTSLDAVARIGRMSFQELF